MNDLGVHLLRYLCESECIVAHDTFSDTIAIVVSKSGAHVQKEVSHLFPCHTQRRMDIMITKEVFEPWQTLSLPIQLVQI
jgi:hypothetical protein